MRGTLVTEDHSDPSPLLQPLFAECQRSASQVQFQTGRHRRRHRTGASVFST